MKMALGIVTALAVALVTFAALSRLNPMQAVAAPAEIIAPASVMAESSPSPSNVQYSAPLEGHLRVCSPEETKLVVKLTEAQEEIAALKAENSAREQQWNRFFDSVNARMRQLRQPIFERIQKQTGAAINDGLYGEGRPSTGAYGPNVKEAGNVHINNKW